MGIENIFQQFLNLTGSFNLWLILALFFLPLIGEFGVSPPYAMESLWLLAGYQVSVGMATPVFILLCCLITLSGRQAGAFALYKVSGLGSTRFARLYNKIQLFKENSKLTTSRFRKYVLSPLANLIVKNFSTYYTGESLKEDKKNSPVIKIRNLSSFRLALGRFIWLKIPLTITTGITRQPAVLLFGVALFSLAWDAIYILMGVFGISSGLKPINMILYMFGGVVFINFLIFGINRLVNSSRVANST
jgi:membrane-associated protein